MPIRGEDFTKYQKCFGKNLRKIRKQCGMTQLDLASLIDIDKASISRIENGRANIMLSTSIAISIALQIPLSKLYDIDVLNISDEKGVS